MKHPDEPETTALSAETPVFDGGGGTILVAEDDEGTRDSITAILRHFGYEVIEAVDGRDAVSRFASHKERIDLVLLDVIMPEMNGRQARDEILAVKGDTKVIFMSGYGGNVLQAYGLSDNGQQLLEKPVRPQALLKTVRDTLGQPL